MDFVITETGIHAAGPEGLQAEEDLLAVPARVEEILAARRLLGQAELAGLLNTLLEAERAGAKVVAAFLSELSIGADARERLLRIQRDESRNCAILIALLRGIDAVPSRATGSFLEAALATQGDRERLEFLNRGQRWVTRRIAAALPRIADPRIREALRAMQESHLTNIDVCRRVLEDELAVGAD